jgi:hypothetical protein
MPRSYTSPTLDDAKQMLSAAEAKAASFGIAYDIAVVDVRVGRSMSPVVRATRLQLFVERMASSFVRRMLPF